MTESGGFFAKVLQRDIAIRGVPCRTPTFYRDVRMLMGVFTADLAACRAQVAPAGLSPVSVAPGRGLAAIHAFAYHDTDAGPYDELAVSIAVRPQGSLLPGPILAAQSALTGAFHGHVVTMPVSTELALWGGLDFFNFPKYLADIQFEETAAATRCTLRDPATLALELELVGKRLQTRPGGRTGMPAVCTFNSYPVFEGRLSQARVRLRIIEGGTSYSGDGLSLRFGDAERGSRLAALGLGRLLMYWDVPRAEAILYTPVPL